MKRVALCYLIMVFVVSFRVQADVGLTEQQKLYGLSLFWKEAAYNFAYFEKQPNLNWDEKYQAFIPKVLATKNTFEYYRVMQEFSALLKDGHTDITPPDGLYKKEMNVPPLLLTEANRQAIVSGVHSTLATQIPLGSRLVSINGKLLEPYLREIIFPYISASSEHVLWDAGVRLALRGKSGSQVKVVFITPDGVEITRVIKRNKRDLGYADYKYLELPWGKFKLFEYRSMPNNIAYIALNWFGDKKIIDEFNVAYSEVKKASGLIIDLRFNGGGDTNIGVEILSNFMNKDLLGPSFRTRQHVATYKAWGKLNVENRTDSLPVEYQEFALDNAWIKLNPDDAKLRVTKRDVLIVPTIILISRNTGSAAEDFLIYASQLEQVTTLGENTTGSTGQPIHFNLPGGGSFRICTKRDAYPDGREFVGIGITPNIYIQQTPEILRGGKDVVLSRAIEELSKKMLAF